MAEPTALPTCSSCGAIRTPGAPMCLTCWLPFDEDPAPRPAAPSPMPSIPAQAPAPAAYPAQPVAPGVSPAAAAYPAPVAPAYPSAPAATFGATQQMSYVATAPAPFTTPAIIPSRSRRAAKPAQSRRTVTVVTVLAMVAVAAGGWMWFRHGETSDEQRIAAKFHESQRLDLPVGVPVVPEIDAGPAGATTEPGVFVASVDPIVRRADTDIIDLQTLLDSWADGKATDSQVRSAFVGFMNDLTPFTDLTEQAPDTLYPAVKNLVTAANGYTIAAGGILDWLDSRSDDARSRYFVTVGDAAASWDAGLVGLYRSTTLRQPPLPHDQG